MTGEMQILWWLCTYDKTNHKGDETVNEKKPKPAWFSFDVSHFEDACCEERRNDTCNLHRGEQLVFGSSNNRRD